MTATPSHRLKLQRAEQHLVNLNALVVELGKRRPYPVSETFDPKRQEWGYRLDLTSVQPPEMFPIIFGEFLFNVRSALDHLVVAIAPNKFKDRVSFPIFTIDPLATDERSGAYLDAQASRAWLSRTKGLPGDCIAALLRLQPHEMARQHPIPAVDLPLAILSALQNADKHRELVSATTGLRGIRVRIDGGQWDSDLAQDPDPILDDATKFFVSPTQVHVEIEGSAIVGIGRPNDIRPYGRLVDRLMAFVGQQVLPRLEPFLPGGSRHQTSPPTG